MAGRGNGQPPSAAPKASTDAGLPGAAASKLAVSALSLLVSPITALYRKLGDAVHHVEMYDDPTVATQINEILAEMSGAGILQGMEIPTSFKGVSKMLTREFWDTKIRPRSGLEDPVHTRLFGFIAKLCECYRLAEQRQNKYRVTFRFIGGRSPLQLHYLALICLVAAVYQEQDLDIIEEDLRKVRSQVSSFLQRMLRAGGSDAPRDAFARNSRKLKHELRTTFQTICTEKRLRSLSFIYSNALRSRLLRWMKHLVMFLHYVGASSDECKGSDLHSCMWGSDITASSKKNKCDNALVQICCEVYRALGIHIHVLSLTEGAEDAYDRDHWSNPLKLERGKPYIGQVKRDVNAHTWAVNICNILTEAQQNFVVEKLQESLTNYPKDTRGTIARGICSYFFKLQDFMQLFSELPSLAKEIDRVGKLALASHHDHNILCAFNTALLKRCIAVNDAVQSISMTVDALDYDKVKSHTPVALMLDEADQADEYLNFEINGIMRDIGAILESVHLERKEHVQRGIIPLAAILRSDPEAPTFTLPSVSYDTAATVETVGEEKEDVENRLGGDVAVGGAVRFSVTRLHYDSRNLKASEYWRGCPLTAEDLRSMGLSMKPLPTRATRKLSEQVVTGLRGHLRRILRQHPFTAITCIRNVYLLKPAQEAVEQHFKCAEGAVSNNAVMSEASAVDLLQCGREGKPVVLQWWDLWLPGHPLMTTAKRRFVLEPSMVQNLKFVVKEAAAATTKGIQRRRPQCRDNLRWAVVYSVCNDHILPLFLVDFHDTSAA